MEVASLAIVPIVVPVVRSRANEEQQPLDMSPSNVDSDGNDIEKHPQHLHDKDAIFSKHKIRVYSKTDSVEVINNL